MKVKFLNGREEEFETLAGANLAGADLRGADLRGANLRWTALRGAQMKGADLRGANMSNADFYGASIQGADLQCANLRDADLRCADLSGADLERADLRWTALRGAQMTGADLRGAIFEIDVVCLGALLGAILDKEQYARLRDILDEVGKTVDDEGTRAQVKRDREIHDHYEHAKEKHPVFADILSTGGFTLGARHYKAHMRIRHDAGECTPMDILFGEYLEVLEAIDAKDKTQAVYECYDCIAVLLRLIDMIEETAEKEGWKEEAR